ncbi:MAG: excinuclease ABC subunit A [Candidatus Dadabacteria bacterium]
MKGEINILGARENNLKNINISIPWHKYTVITGLSGSGKSSLALDTLYAEGMRRYVECLSTYARQFFERVDRPDMDDITGLPPVIAIESRNQVKNSRSTVGTTTEIYDYLRLLFAKIGRIFCPNCQIEIKRHSPQSISEDLIKNNRDKKALITFPIGENGISPQELMSKGFIRIIYQGEVIEVEELSMIPEGSEAVVDRIVINKNSSSRITDSIETAFSESNYINVHFVDRSVLKYSRDLECPYCQRRFNKPTPLLFSFNSPQGACPACRGFGNILDIDPDLVVPNPEKGLAQGAIEPLTKPSLKDEMKELLQFARRKGIDINTPFKSLPEDAKKSIFEGEGRFPGVKGYFRYLEEKSYKLHVRIFLSKYRSAFTCGSCNGTRLRPEALWVKVEGKKISDIADMPIEESSIFFQGLTLSDYEEKIAGEVLKQIRSRIDFLQKVGLGYITLSRLTKTLSGGEAQRVDLACQLGASLSEVLYIMDEPSIGLHPRDIDKLISIIRELRDRNNTVVVVEHDFDMIRSADYIIELGPLAGERGGEVVYQGPTEKFLNNSHQSITRLYLTQKERIPIPIKRRREKEKNLTVIGTSENNLKNITVSFPLGTFVCVTGVSGSGKSSLVHDVVYSSLARIFHSELEKVDKCREISGTSYISDVVMLDQTPIGKSSRSNPVTYIKAYDEIRRVMSDTWEARARGFSASHFSFNVPGGRCETCQGEGRQKIEMHFLADIFVTCEECHGRRFKKEVLDVRYKGKNVAEILNLTIDEGIWFFSDVLTLIRKLKILQDVGLGYLRLGQPAPTLSGGEAQRIKIARELGRKDGKNILYILDEPTVGLHIEDIKKLLRVLNRLVDAGNTVIVVEHNLDVIKSADYIIDLGPEGGERGGYIIAQGTPEEVAKIKESYTGIYLNNVLQRQTIADPL